MELQYRLEKSEIEESLLCLDWRKEGWRKKLNLLLLFGVAVISLLEYWMHPEQFFLLMFAGIAVALMFALLYLREHKRKRKAARTTAKGNECRITVPTAEIKRGFESEHVFTLQTAEEMYCIPKRILNAEQETELREQMNKYAAKTYKVITGREDTNGERGKTGKS